MNNVVAAYSRVWKLKPQLVHSGLNAEWNNKKDAVVFKELFELAVKCNLSTAALFAYSRREELPELADIVEKEAMLQIGNTVGREIKPEDLWKSLVLIWNQDNGNVIQQALKQLYREVVQLDEEMTSKEKVAAINNCVSLFIEPLKEEGILYTALYIRSMYVLRQCMEPLDFSGKEVFNKETLDIATIDDFTQILMKQHVETLYDEKNFRACAAFLDKTKNLNYEEIFGKTEEEFGIWLLESESTPLAECYRRIRGYYDEEGLNIWRDKLYFHVKDKICLNWGDWLYYSKRLENLLDKDELTEDEFWEAARKDVPSSPYPVEELLRINIVAGGIQYVCSEVFRRNWNILELIQLWGFNNLYAYDNRKFMYVKPKTQVKFRNRTRFFDWELNYQNFLVSAYSSEEKVTIFMNSPLRLEVEFRNFVIAIAEEAGEEKISELFAPYVLEGYLCYTDTLSSARGKYRFEIDIRFFKSKFFFRNRITKDYEFFNSLLFVDENWLRNNEQKMYGIKQDSHATFRLCGYESTGVREGIISVCDIESIETQAIEPKEEMLEILSWIQSIKEKGEYIPITKKDFLNVYLLKEVGLQKRFAIEILETVYALRDKPGELLPFMGTINQGRLDKINEFQYILTHKAVRTFMMPQQEFYEFVKSVQKIAYGICEDERVSNQMKCNIYMNTCLKCFFPLPEFWSRAGIRKEDMLSYTLQNNEYNQFMFFLTYKGEKDGYGIFAMQKNYKIRATSKSGELFVWQGEVLPEECIGTPYRVTISDIDIVKKIIWIGKIFPEDIVDSWREVIGSIRDLKKKASYTYIDEVSQNIVSRKVDCFARRRITQLAKEFQSLFERAGKEEYSEEYNLRWCIQILKVFGEGQNPFLQKERCLQACPPTSFEIEEWKKNCVEFLDKMFEKRRSDSKYFSEKEMEEFLRSSHYSLAYTEEEMQELLGEYYANGASEPLSED